MQGLAGALFLLLCTSAARGWLKELEPYKNLITVIHNFYRSYETRAADMKEMKWDDSLQRKAEIWSENCYFDHQRDGLGENLAFVVTGGADMQDLDIIVRSCRGWWNEVYNWTWSTTCAYACHYTQMIWGETERLGCSLSKCPQMQVDTGKNMDDIDFFVCFYDPPGNSIGKYPYTLGEPCSHCDRLDECHGGLCKSPSLNNSNSTPATNPQPQSEATLTDSAMTDANVYKASMSAPSQELNVVDKYL